GLLASRVGTAASLGFVVETERQVEAHLDSHLQKLPAQDHASRAVVTRMRDDEIRHARQAQQAGAAEVPLPVKWLMKGAAQVMTTVAHRI
ncbi:MAG TPA: demethoxyubiquinone hydroxylase family protein, partial [Burkholderiaceae bacterium]|nr:demethoxyubiquinone hydroxylase family protein [Burkholderiaceae bacterium]